MLDRVLLYFSLTASQSRLLNVQITPVVTIWNPYDVAIEAEGYMVYPSVDMPIFVNCKETTTGTNLIGDSLSRYMGRGHGGEGVDKWTKQDEGRMGEPYFYCKITSGGTQDVGGPVRLEPGEVRVFAPVEAPTIYDRKAVDQADRRMVLMKPAEGAVSPKGGLLIPLQGTRLGNNDEERRGVTHGVRTNYTYETSLNLNTNDYTYFMSLEGADRIKDKTLPALANVPRITETQVLTKQGTSASSSRLISGAALAAEPQIFGVVETFHRTAAGTNPTPTDIVSTFNPRHRHTNTMISGTKDITTSHYMTAIRAVTQIDLQSRDGKRAFYGESNGTQRNETWSFFTAPRSPMLSLGAFQGADLANSAFAPGSPFGNSWASAYLPSTTTGMAVTSAAVPDGASASGALEPNGIGLFDHSYLLNSALWDGFFFSSLAPVSTPGSAPSSVDADSVYQRPLNRERQSAEDVTEAWLDNPRLNPLANSRFLPYAGGATKQEIVDKLMGDAGSLNAAAHMLVEGAFNVNSTNEKAWRAVLASLKGTSFDVTSSSGSTATHDSGDGSPLPRLSEPRGDANDKWEGFRELSDTQIEELAKQIVSQVRLRGPFQSLGEFVNRRISNDALGFRGALQTAIDSSGINNAMTVTNLTYQGYPYPGNIAVKNSGVGIPGWLTQADLLNSLGPFITVRSDTFTIRAYGDSRDSSGNILARSYCEATIQRVPDWVDPTDKAEKAVEDNNKVSQITQINQNFGRRFEIVSIREISQQEFGL